jgi:hypothetical protein
LKVARGEYKGANFCRHESRTFEVAVSYAAIFGENDPAVVSDGGKPVLILGIGRKIIVVDVDCSPSVAQRCRDTLLSERTV